MRNPVCVSATQKPSSEILISAAADGAILPVYAQPGARRSGIVGAHSRWLKVAVTAPPEKGKANQALEEVLADAINVKRSQVRQLTGVATRQKTFLIAGLSVEELQARLAAILAGNS